MSGNKLRLTSIAVLLFCVAWAAPSSARANDLSGCWTGCWRSSTTGHKGPLKARFERCGDQQYDVTFSGRFFKLLPFRFSVTLDVVEDSDDTVTLAGDSFLGRMFGTFHYDATATGDDFVANYSSCKDRGVFSLHRCCGK